jgi:hypothetical protein
LAPDANRVQAQGGEMPGVGRILFARAVRAVTLEGMHNASTMFASGPWLVSRLVGLGVAAAVAQAASLGVLNPSFESPSVPNGFPAITIIDSWQKTPENPDSGFPPGQWDQLSGLFENAAVGQPRHIENADGNQVAFLFAVQGVGISQQLGDTFAAGVSYELSLGIRGGGALTPGTTFQVGLFYMDGSTPVTLGSTTVTATAEFATATQLMEVSATTGAVASGAPAVGKNIGIQLLAASNNGAPGIAYWEIDKVAVTAVPEPETYALAFGGALLGVAGWRRWQRSR